MALSVAGGTRLALVLATVTSSLAVACGGDSGTRSPRDEADGGAGSGGFSAGSGGRTGSGGAAIGTGGAGAGGAGAGGGAGTGGAGGSGGSGGQVDGGGDEGGSADAGPDGASSDDGGTTQDASADAAPDVTVTDGGGSGDATLDAGPVGDGSVEAGPSVPEAHFWVDWTAATSGTPGSATGSITLSEAGTLTVSYAGHVLDAQVSGGTNYWLPAAPYTANDVVANEPPAADVIRLAGGATVNTLTFSAPVTNPVMAVVSVGQGGLPVSYDFDAPFDVLSEGQGYWGDGTLVEEPGDVLTGREGHGVIQFRGTFTTISWTIVGNESWHGFQIGIPDQP